MKLDLKKNLKDYNGLISPLIASYWIALSPIITAILATFAQLVVGETTSMGLLSAQIYFYAFGFPILFLSLDLYKIILKERKFDGVKQTIKTKPEMFVLLGFLIWAFVATFLQLAIFGKSKAYTTIVTPFGIQEGLFAFTIYALIFLMGYWVKNRNIAKNILLALLLSAIFVCISGFIDPTAKLIYQPWQNTPWASMFFNSNHFGYFLSIVTPLSAGVFMFTKKKWKQITALILLVFFTTTSMFVDTFGSLIATFVVFVLIPIIMWWFKKDFSWKYLVPLGVFIVVSTIVTPIGKLYHSTYTNFFAQLLNLFKEFFLITSAPTSNVAQKAGTNRWGLWLMAFEEITQSPLIGTGNVLLRPHNEYLQYAQVWGLPSLIIYLSAFVVILVKAIKHRKKLSHFSLSLLFIVGTYLIGSTFGNTMPHTIPFFLLITAFLIRFMNEDIYKKTTPLT